MGKLAIALFTLATYSAAIAVPMVVPVEVEAAGRKNIEKQKRKLPQHSRVNRSWSAGQAWPASVPFGQTGVTCFRGIDCATWPPPIYNDPDRKPAGADH